MMLISNEPSSEVKGRAENTVGYINVNVFFAGISKIIIHINK